jgi:hypothetical protein
VHTQLAALERAGYLKRHRAPGPRADGDAVGAASAAGGRPRRGRDDPGAARR